MGTPLLKGIISGASLEDGVLCDNSERLDAANYYHKALHLGCCSSPRSASAHVIIRRHYIASQAADNFYCKVTANTSYWNTNSRTVEKRVVINHMIGWL